MAGVKDLADNNGVQDILMKHICPGIGVILSNATIISPMNSFRLAVSRGRLGDLNPVPFAILTGNVLGWTVYAFMKKDIYLTLANMPGLFITIWYNAGAIKLQYLESQQQEESKKQEVMTEEGSTNAERDPPREDSSSRDGPSSSSIFRNENLTKKSLNEHFIQKNEDLVLPLFSSQEILLLLSVFVWAIILCVVSSDYFTHNQNVDIVGVSANINLIFFYAAPLSTIWQVIQSRDSSSIHRPLLIMMFLGSTFWFIYGLAKSDPFIMVPNGCGFILNTVQGILCVIYPFQVTL